MSIGAAGFGAQALGLPRPPRGDRVGATAVGWLLRYRLVAGSERVNDAAAARVVCFQGWLPSAVGAGRGTVLALGARRLVLTRRGLRAYGYAAPAPAVALLQLEAAGCGRVLATRLAAWIQSGRPLRARSVLFEGRPALRLALATRGGRLNLFVTRRLGIPFAVDATLRGGRLHGAGVFRLTRVRPSVLRRLLAGARPPAPHEQGPRSA